MLPLLLLSLLLPALSLAQDGSVTGPTSSSEAAGYSCDSSACQLPKCNCASTSPPGGLNPVISLSLSPPPLVLLEAVLAQISVIVPF
jgi:hypothetical protein